MTKSKKITITCPWGYWDIRGNWYPNTKLKMSADEQYKANVKNGYIKSYAP